MKRLILRLSALSGIIVLGLIAIAHAQRSLSSASQAEQPAKTPPRLLRDRAATPIADTRTSAAAVSSDPFAATRGRAPVARSTAKRSVSRETDSSYAVDPEERSPYTEARDDIPPAREALGGENAQSTAGRRSEPAAYEERPDSHPFAQAYTEREPSRYDDARLTAAEEPVSPQSRFGEARPSDLRADEPRRLEAASGTAEPDASNPAAGDFATPRAMYGVGVNTQAGAQDAGLPQENPASPVAGSEGTGRPGNKELDGTQSPALTIEKTAPAEIQVGKPAIFTITVRNVGQATANGVEVHDEVPKGTQLVGTKPSFAAAEDGKLVWSVGSLKPGDEVKAEIELMPVAEGEIGSIATAHFRAEASVRTISTRPQLALEVTAPPKVMIGEEVVLKIKMTNSGTGAATGMVLTETVPASLKHASGSQLEFEVGTLKPGETRELDLPLTAAQPGLVSNVVTARGDANVQVDANAEFEVIAPALKVAMTGPKRRYLERKATYNLSVSNPGTAPAKDVELVTVLPKGLKFVEANNEGHYDTATHSVYWSLAELPAKETGTVTLTALPIEAGDHRLQIKGQAQQGLKDEREETVVVEGLAAILFELVDVQDPIEVGGETSYEIRVINQGSKAANNVQLVAILPAGLKAVSADGPARHAIDRNQSNDERVYFDPLAQLAPKADTTYSIKVQGVAPGDQRIQVKLQSDEVRDPITKEESTRVYSDD